jgi:hypothetical protein
MTRTVAAALSVPYVRRDVRTLQNRSLSRRTPTRTTSSGLTRFERRACARERCVGRSRSRARPTRAPAHLLGLRAGAVRPAVPASLMIFNDGRPSRTWKAICARRTCSTT